MAFHRHYPLFASGSDDGSVIVCHGMVYKYARARAGRPRRGGREGLGATVRPDMGEGGDGGSPQCQRARAVKQPALPPTGTDPGHLWALCGVRPPLEHPTSLGRVCGVGSQVPERVSGSQPPLPRPLCPSDLLQNPLIVPVKVLKGHAPARDLGVLDVLFHPTQPWLFSSGADATIRLFT